MRDLFPVTIAPEAIYSDRLRIEPIIGDSMAPRLRSGVDFVLIKPVDSYQGEGTYLWSDGVGKSFCNVHSVLGGKLRLWHENKLYSEHFLTREEFAEICLGIVVADVAVRAEHILRAELAN